MRLFLLPISTRRTLIFCERVQESFSTTTPGAKAPYSERLITKASETWAGWEKKESGWQKKVTEAGNTIFRRIPFEEWGLKTIPPATNQRIKDVDAGKLGTFECLYPGAYLKEGKVLETLKRIAVERQGLHGRRIWQSVALMPVVAPFALVPVIPNLPFFYLCFRAYSHYRALYGGKMLEHLLGKNLVKTTASTQLDLAYTSGLLQPSRQNVRDAAAPTSEEVEAVKNMVEAQTDGGKEEVMVLQKWNGKLLAEAFHLPEMEIEIERAVEQVEKDLQKKKDAVPSAATKEEVVVEKKER